jgi:hypothetical protein
MRRQPTMAPRFASPMALALSSNGSVIVGALSDEARFSDAGLFTLGHLRQERLIDPRECESICGVTEGSAGRAVEAWFNAATI